MQVFPCASPGSVKCHRVLYSCPFPYQQPFSLCGSDTAGQSMVSCWCQHDHRCQEFDIADWDEESSQLPWGT